MDRSSLGTEDQCFCGLFGISEVMLVQSNKAKAGASTLLGTISGKSCRKILIDTIDPGRYAAF
jgi:hypothetical protein